MASRLLFAVVMAACALGGLAQELTWNVGLDAVFDNREGDRDNTATETIFFTKLKPEAGFNLNGSDRFGGGGVWIEPVGYDWNGRRFRPTLYYRHEGRHWSGSVGIFPRSQLVEQLPSFMWCDSLTYFQDNIRGALLQYRRGKSYAEIYLDWRQRQTETRRESFSIVAQGRWTPRDGRFSLGVVGSMNHLALTKHAPADMHIVDNFSAAPYAAANLSGIVPVDTLGLRLGMAMTVERNRAVGSWRSPAGVWFEVKAAWRRFGLRNNFYAGGKLFPSYTMLGAQLYQGEPFYQQSLYNRTEVDFAVVRNRYVDLRAELDFNITPGSFIFYQRILLRVYFGQRYKLRAKNDI